MKKLHRPRRGAFALCLRALPLGLASLAHAQGPATPPTPSASATLTADQSITIRGHYDNAVGSGDAASSGVIRAELLKSRPPLRPGEVLEFVPGVIVTQHSGDGKANQYFLRGFNLDHGTDFATRINGMPVNMPSHGHGQGYTDLNFLLPELVQRIEYRKGPYFASNGDFSSAGSADIAYVRRLDAPFGQISIGKDGYRRGVAGASFDIAPGLTLLGAVEAQRNDGPWTVPEGLKKSNGVLTLSGGSTASGWSASLMGYRSKWTATDQIPQRLIDSGTLDGRPFGRFDSLDPTTGGDTFRSSLSGEWHHESALGRSKVSAYSMRYRLDLNSNFTYILERPWIGDQFKQQDRRSVYGLDASHAIGHVLAGLPVRSELGLQVRHDRISVGLYESAAREIQAVTRADNVRETLFGLYGQSAIEFSPTLRAVFGLRADHLRARVEGLTDAANSGSARDTQVSPKLSVILGPFAALPKTEFFVNAGRGFHSNDARGMTDPAAPVPPLAASRGFEVGARTEIIRGLQSSLALWALKSDSELVYVGDAGSTEASAASSRRGIEWSNRYIPLPWLLFDADFAWSHARFDNGDRIPNAVDRVASLAATVRDLQGWSASLQWRYLGPGALIEDNSVRSKSSLTTNLRVSRTLGPKAEVTLDVFNLLDRKVNDIQYYYESRVPGEAPQGVFDRHVHPAEPRTLRMTLMVKF